MSSTEIIILAVTGISASLLYISRHLITSKCWTHDECCSLKLRRDSTPASPVAIIEEPKPHANITPPPSIISSVI
jgi:hypothetical protein